MHDLPRRFGNIDHVLIGPPGIYLLETKNVSGELRVVGDELQVTWADDPDDPYVQRSIASRVRAAAVELSRALSPTNGRGPWVQSIVVLWGRFDQETVEYNRVVWTHGEVLAAFLKAQTQRRLLTPDEVAQIADGVRAVAASHNDG